MDIKTDHTDSSERVLASRDIRPTRLSRYELHAQANGYSPVTDFHVNA